MTERTIIAWDKQSAEKSRQQAAASGKITSRNEKTTHENKTGNYKG